MGRARTWILAVAATKNAQLLSIRRELAQLKARDDESPMVREIEDAIEGLATNLGEIETAAMRRDEAASQRNAILRNAFSASQQFAKIWSVRFEDLQAGQRVSFTQGQGPKGPRAEHVKPI